MTTWARQPTRGAPRGSDYPRPADVDPVGVSYSVTESPLRPLALLGATSPMNGGGEAAAIRSDTIPRWSNATRSMTGGERFQRRIAEALARGVNPAPRGRPREIKTGDGQLNLL